MARLLPSLRRHWKHAEEVVVYRALRGLASVIGALPARWVLGAGDLAGHVLFALDARGRRAGRQNLDVVFPGRYTKREKHRLLVRSMQNGARALGAMLHAAPLTERNVRRWVDLDPADERHLKEGIARTHGAVVATAHLGNWEILLGLASIFGDALPLRFLAEDTFHPGFDRFLAWVRGTSGGRSARRRGGAHGLQAHVQKGGGAGIVVDRNARRRYGGIYAPFCGVDAATTPLAAWLARKNDVPIAPIFCLPQADGRYRIHLEPEPSRDVRSDDFNADVLEITTRLNRIVEALIHAHPEAWTWSLKRFKSRPTEEQGRYPAYSHHDP